MNTETICNYFQAYFRDFFKKHISMLSHLKQDRPMASKVVDNEGGESVFLPTTFETMFHSVPSRISSSIYEAQLQADHK